MKLNKNNFDLHFLFFKCFTYFYFNNLSIISKIILKAKNCHEWFKF